MLVDDSRLGKIAEYKKPAMTVYTRPRNNAETIIRAKLPPKQGGMVTRSSQGKEEGFKRCGEAMCNMCPHTGTAPGEIKKKVKISSTGEYLPIRGTMNCNSKDILYLAGHDAEKTSRSCPEKPQYFGQTGRTGKQRCKEHKGTITYPCHQTTNTPIGRHYRDSPGHDASQLMFIPVEKQRSNDPFIRRAREKMYINRFQMLDAGLNKNL